MSSGLSTESNWRTSGLKRTKIGSVDQDPDPYCEYGSGTTLPIEYGSNMDPDPQPCLGLHKVCPGYRRSLQLTKEAIQHFKTWIFSTFVGHFCPPGSGSGSVFKLRIRIQWSDWIRIQYGSGSRSETLVTNKVFFGVWTRHGTQGFGSGSVSGSGSVLDPDPYWIRIQSDHWIRIRIQEGKNGPQK